jgi:type II secretory ATPase GspE/PulE/Tfp pilus assembly ATPase PilB-like protein
MNQLAIEEGMISMQTDGLVKALQGQTTLEEIMRVTTER